MIQTSSGPIPFTSSWLKEAKDVVIRGPLKDEIILQNDGTTGIIRAKPRVNVFKEEFTYQAQ